MEPPPSALTSSIHHPFRNPFPLRKHASHPRHTPSPSVAANSIYVDATNTIYISKHLPLPLPHVAGHVAGYVVHAVTKADEPTDCYWTGNTPLCRTDSCKPGYRETDAATGRVYERVN